MKHNKGIKGLCKSRICWVFWGVGVGLDSVRLITIVMLFNKPPLLLSRDSASSIFYLIMLSHNIWHRTWAESFGTNCRIPALKCNQESQGPDEVIINFVY